MKPATPRPARCAIYTRKSTEHNLDLEFNSLDAQREACEAYIKSQAHEGWRLIPSRDDDGGLSGGSLDRPALQTLLTDIRSRKIDVVVVYKVDRLTRSLGDFAKLVELFDQYAVSFVSVTQSFNTTSGMGRLTLNVLLSFAQFEREVIGERVRDKIAASKQKGIWVGGAVPLGYASINKKLVVVPQDAEKVRTIFRRYLELGSVAALAQDLEADGIRSRRQVLANGKIRGDIPFGIGALAYLLRNRFFIGEVVYQGAIHRGEQEPILDRDLFEAVQAKLAAQAVQRQSRLNGSPAILRGRIFDDRGNRMSPTHSNKRGARYRYYISHPILQWRRAGQGEVSRIPAPEIESLVVAAIRNHLTTEAPQNDRELVERYVERVVIKPTAIELRVRDANTSPGQARDETPAEFGDAPATTIRLPWTNATRVKVTLHAPTQPPTLKPQTRDALLEAIAKARAWTDELVNGRVHSLAEVARREQKVLRHIRLLSPLAFVSPRIVSAIIDGSAPANLTVTGLVNALPYSWAEQERRWGPVAPGLEAPWSAGPAHQSQHPPRTIRS